MVGSLLLLKLLQCKRSRRSKIAKEETEPALEPDKIKIEPQNELYTCRVCLKDGYVPEAELKARYHCQRCNLDFASKNEYDQHIFKVGHGSRKVVCTVCNNYYTENYLRRHKRLHQADLSFVCDICGKKIFTQGHFSRHRLTHFYDLPYKCSLCPYRGRFTESLKMHMRSHTGDKPYKCSECGKCFISKSNLNKHMLTHNPECRFKCDTCGKGVSSKRDLILHFKVDHTGIKDHICEICGEAFGYRNQMTNHQLKVHKRAKLRSGRLPLYLQVESKQRSGQRVPISDSVILEPLNLETPTLNE